MKILYRFFGKKRRWMIVVMLLMTASTTYTLLDAFVFAKVYAVVETVQDVSDLEQKFTEGENLISAKRNSSTETFKNTYDSVEEQVVTETSYKDDNISISIETVNENGVVFYVADIEISDMNYLKTALAENIYGKNVTETTSEMAENNEAIFAINGDFYGFRDSGLVIRNGVLYRDTDGMEPDEQAMIIDENGNMYVMDPEEYSGEELIEMGIMQGFAFGPTLVENGEIVSNTASSKLSKDNPRTAIGQISELHYIVIVVDGRADESEGMSLSELALEFVERGAVVAYNLDGGGSATMWFNNEVVNNPTNGKTFEEREVSDILYIGY